jgi:hypothetical protein
LRSVAVRVPGLIGAGICACLLSGGAAGTTNGPETAAAAQPAAIAAAVSETIVGTHFAVGASDTAFGTFLDRLMHAESAGRDSAANPRSTALGPFQFIKSTLHT